MKTFLKIAFAFIVGILFSGCRVANKPPEPAPGEKPVVEEEADIEIDHELEIIDALEIDPYWGPEIKRDTGEVFERVLRTCVEIEDGALIQDVILDMMNEEIPQLSAEHMAEVAIFIVCPEFESNYEAYLKSRN